MELRFVYVREEYGVGQVSGVGRYRSTRHLGFEVADPSGRHGWPAIVRWPGKGGTIYNGMQYEFGIDPFPKWTFVW